MPEITVITRTCDRPAFLARAIAGLRSQDAAFEWVVVDDGQSPIDATLLKGVGASQQIITPSEPLGRTAAAAAGLEAATGRYLMLHDDDDALEPGALSALSASLDERPGDVAVTCGFRTILDTESGTAETRMQTFSGPIDFYDMAERNLILTIGTLFRADAYRQVGGIRTDIDALEDWDLWLRLLCLGDIGTVPDIYARQYVRPEGTGPDANTPATDHASALTRLRNAYLRRDINEGRLGLGELVHRPHARFVEEMGDRVARASQLKGRFMPWRKTSTGDETKQEG